MGDPLYLLPPGIKPSIRLERVCHSSGTTNELNSTKALRNNLLQNGLAPLLPDHSHSSAVVKQKILLQSQSPASDLAVPDPHQTSSICPDELFKSFQTLVEVWTKLNKFIEKDAVPRVMQKASSSPEFAVPFSKLWEEYNQLAGYPLKFKYHVTVEGGDKKRCMVLSAYKSSDSIYSKDQALFNTVMQALWHARRWSDIMSMLAAYDSEQGLVLNSIVFLTRALEERQHGFDPIQKQAYTFLAGISAMIQNKGILAQSLISQAYFGELPLAMREEALSILAVVASKAPGCLNVYDELRAATLQGIIHHEHQIPNSKLSVLLPTDEELSPPERVSSRLSGMLQSKGFNCLIKEKEEKTLELEAIHDEEKMGNFYLDLMQSCKRHVLITQMRSKACVLTSAERQALNRDLNKFGIDTNAMTAGCLIVAALWYLKKLQRVSSSKRKACTTQLKKKINKCLEDAFTLAQSKHMDPGMKVYVSRMCAGAELACIRCTEDTTTVDELKFLIRLFRSLNEICCLTPFWSIPSVSVYETALLSYNLGRLHSGFTLHRLRISPEAHTVNHRQLMHQLYENHFTGVLPLENPEQALTKASECFLREKNLTLDDVAQLIRSPFTPCDRDGWPNHLSDSRHESMRYASIDGFIINLHGNTDAVTIDVKCQAVDKGKGIFSENDLRLSFAVLSSMDNPMNLTFSLDPPSGEQYPLFQEVRFDPRQIEDTPILQVMLEADLLLKQLTTGSEISCKPPFHQRPSYESLTKILPPHLRTGLQPPKPNYRFSYHRFWIKAEEICYDLVNDKTIKIGEVKMVVHHHPQKQCADGRRCDTAQEDPKSDESKFASFFTEHFDELATYYPVLARLKELCKIQLVAKIVKEKLHSIVQSPANGVQHLPSFSIGEMGLAVSLVSIIPTFVAYRKYIQSPSKGRKKKRKPHSIKYVPSTFFRGRNQRCTGGVVLQPKLSSRTSQHHYTCVSGKGCSTAPTSSTQAVRSVDQVLHRSSDPTLQPHFDMPQTKLSATESVDQTLHSDSYSSMNETQKSSDHSKVTTSTDQALHECYRTDKRTILVACNPTVSVRARAAAAAAATRNSKASASESQNTSNAAKGFDQIVHDQADFAHRQNPPRAQSIERFMHDSPSRMHEARFKSDPIQVTKSMDEILHDDQGNPFSCPEYPSESATSTIYPKGVKLAPMITCKQATSTSHSIFEGCPSVYLKVGNNGPSIDQLKVFQPLQNANDSGNECVDAASWTNPQPLDKSSPSFTVNTNKWKHLSIII